MTRAEEVLASSYEKLLEFALTHQGDPDAARIPQLEAERDAALTKARNLENVRDELREAQRIVVKEREQYDYQIRVRDRQIEQAQVDRDEAVKEAHQLREQLATLTAERDGLQAQQTMDQARFAQMQAELDKPTVAPGWEDLDRFITAAVENFDHDPEKALKNLTRAHLALQGKENTND